MERPQVRGCYKNITQKKYSYLKVIDDIVTYHTALSSKPLDNIRDVMQDLKV